MKAIYDVAVIGGGVIGGTILRELSKYQLSSVLLEKGSDVSLGQSRANSGIVHAGFDALPGTLKAKFNVLGNKMMKEYATELGVKYQNNGSLVIARSQEDLKTLHDLLERGIQNGVSGLEIIDREKLVELEPNITDDAIGALWAKTGGIICPYELTIASIGNAMDNGADLMLDYKVERIEKGDFGFQIYNSLGEKVFTRIVINCAGLGSEEIAKLVGDESFKIGGRKGEYVLLDRESGDFVSHTIFTTPTKKGKGILISNTVDGNIILGPTAVEVSKDDTDTTQDGLNSVITQAKLMGKNVPLFNTITSFAGVRAYSDRHDFVIEESKVAKNFFNVAGVESPGLTSAPAIAKYVVEELVGKTNHLERNKNFNGTRRPDNWFKNLSIKEKNKVIMQDKAYGTIICRCEQVTEGEIIHAIKSNPPAKTIDAVKRRTRAGMGRCQSGFCQSRVAEILARELNVDILKVTKNGKGSEILTGRTK